MSATIARLEWVRRDSRRLGGNIRSPLPPALGVLLSVGAEGRVRQRRAIVVLL